MNKLREQEPLFADVEQIMTNGLFTDVSPYYDADEALGKENLNAAIMEVGTYRDGRYILPLRYNFPVLFVNERGLEAYGLTLEDVDGGIMELLDLAADSQNHALACSVEPSFARLGRGFALLPPVADYDTETVGVTKEEIASLLRKIQKVEALVGDAEDHRRHILIENFHFPYEIQLDGIKYVGKRFMPMFPIGLPMSIGFLDEAVVVAAIGKVSGEEYKMIPLRGCGGQLSAHVTYYGAVGAGCQYPEEAYEFLRLFLGEDAQWERNRPFDYSQWYAHGIPYRYTLIEDGWPVRIKNGTNEVWTSLRTSAYVMGADGLLSRRGVLSTRLTDSDFPLLETKFDHVYFGCVLEQDLARMVRSLNDQDTGEPTDVDIDAMAAEFVRALKFHVDEG